MSSDSPVPAPRLTDEEVAARWRICLHEAGHAVAGRRLLHRTTRALVYANNVGAAYFGGDGLTLQNFDEVLAVAVGPAAEALADRYDPPPFQPGPTLEESYPEPAKALREDMRGTPSDAMTIARWCIAGVEGEPDRWVNHFHWIHHEAQVFVTRNQRKIVEIATGLYARGIITLPAEPAQEGTVHVD